MGQRNGILLLILAMLIAIASTWFNDLWISYQREHRNQIESSQVSYYFADFALLSTNPQGEVEYKLSGQHFSHWTGKDSSEIIRPNLLAFSQNTPSSQIRADTATVSKNDTVELQGAVKITNSSSSNTTMLEADDLRYHPNKQWIETDSNITFTSGNSTITGKGMDSQLDKNILRIHADVLSIFKAQ
jgi:LPS export ABC transporter protein LptC